MDRREFAGLLLAGSCRLAFAQEAEPKAKKDKPTLLEDMGQWVAGMRYEDIPAATVKKAKYLLLDTLGCAIGAVNGKPVQVAQEVIRARGGNPQSTVIGTSWKVPADEAAFLNAMQIRYLDFNDYAAFGFPHHPSINVAPALAVAEWKNMSGRDLLLGLVVGYEVHIKVRDGSEGPRRGFDLPSIEAQYASAACAARLMGLNAEGISNAMAIAGSYANTLAEVRSGGELSNAKGTAEAIAARNGVFSALLGKGGLEYPPTVLDGASGYGKAVNGGLKADLMRKRSGDYEIMKSCTKMWPSIGTAQAPIAAALQLRDKGVKAADVKAITLHLSDFGYQQQKDFMGEINTREHADHSALYLVARAFIDGDVRIEDFEEKRYRDPQAIAFINKIKLVMDPALTTSGGDVLGCKLDVELNNGTKQVADMPYPPGSYQNPATDQQIEHKFANLAEGIVGKAGAKRATDVILAIDSKKDLKELIAALSPARGGAK
jgi:2-methylcitrate dehydratase